MVFVPLNFILCACVRAISVWTVCFLGFQTKIANLPVEETFLLSFWNFFLFRFDIISHFRFVCIKIQFFVKFDIVTVAR